MPNIRFYCDKSKVNKEGFSPIRANIVLDYRSHWQNIEKVKYRYWNNAKQKVDKNRSSEPDNRHEEINSFLEQYDRKSKDFFNDCRLNNIPITSELIRQFYNGQIPDFNNKISFNQTFSNWLDHTKQNNSYNTYRCRKTVFQFFLNFQNDKNFKITFQNIKMPLFDQLKTYAFAEKGYMNNTFAKRINIFKTFLNWAADRSYYSGTEHLKFKAIEKDITPISLTIDEFKVLYNYEFTNPKHQKVRDIFCFGCLTGLRYSDLQQLQREHIRGEQIIKTMQKIKETIKIPLVELSQKIIEKYKEQPVYVLPRMSNQKFNDYLKNICQEAKINAPITIDIYKGNRFYQETKPKYKVITAHTARKTFITLSFYLGMNIKIAQNITGISQEKTLRKYLIISEEMKKTEMEDTWGKL